MNIFVDGIEFAPLPRHGIIIPYIFVSKCAKVWNDKTKRYLKPTADYQTWKGKKGKVKCLAVNILTEGKPFWDAGHKFTEKKKGKGLIELRIKLHIAVMTAWNPYRDYLKMLAYEELLDIAEENMVIDHVDDNPLNNELSNCAYSTSLKNSDIRKKWRELK